MSEKYIDIEMKQGAVDGVHYFYYGVPMVSNPDDIIFMTRSIDTTYDHLSEDMGHFCAVAYWKDGEIRWDSCNPGDPEPIDGLVNEAGDKLKVFSDHSCLTTFLGRPREDFRVEGENLIYQDKYRFKQPADYFNGGDFTVFVKDLSKKDSGTEKGAEHNPSK